MNYILSLFSGKQNRAKYNILIDVILTLLNFNVSNTNDQIRNIANNFFNFNPQVIAILNLSGEIMAYNEMIFALYGYTSHSLIGDNILKYIDADFDLSETAIGDLFTKYLNQTPD